MISRLWETHIPCSMFAPTASSILVIQQMMKEASSTAREALQRYVRRVSYTWDADSTVNDPVSSTNLSVMQLCVS